MLKKKNLHKPWWRQQIKLCTLKEKDITSEIIDTTTLLSFPIINTISFSALTLKLPSHDMQHAEQNLSDTELSVHPWVDLDSGCFVSRSSPLESWNSNNKLSFDIMWQRYRTISNLEETWDEQKKKIWSFRKHALTYTVTEVSRLIL